MKVLYPRAVARSARFGLRRLPGVGDGDRALPDVKLTLKDMEIDREHLVEYDRVCGFGLRDMLPPTYPHLFAFPLAMQLMTDSAFPFPVIGLVHVRNRIGQLRPLRADEPLEVRVWADELGEHDRGTRFDIVAEVDASAEPAWRSRSTSLHIERSSGSKDSAERPEPPPVKAVWRLPGDLGRRDAAG